MILLSDTDIIVKLCACDLMDAALECLGADMSEVRILDEARSLVRHNHEMLAAEYGPEALKRIKRFLKQCETVKSGPIKDQQRLGALMQVDAGEATLFNSTSNYDEFMVITGDKRSLRALGAASGIDDIKDRLSARVYCLEQVVFEVIHTFGMDMVRPRLAAISGVDSSLAFIFQPGRQASNAALLARLRSQIDDLRVDAGDILVP